MTFMEAAGKSSPCVSWILAFTSATCGGGGVVEGAGWSGTPPWAKCGGGERVNNRAAAGEPVPALDSPRRLPGA